MLYKNIEMHMEFYVLAEWCQTALFMVQTERWLNEVAQSLIIVRRCVVKVCVCIRYQRRPCGSLNFCS